MLISDTNLSKFVLQLLTDQPIENTSTAVVGFQPVEGTIFTLKHQDVA